jgi:hypothetical protein
MGMRNSVPQHLLDLHRAILQASEEPAHLKAKQNESNKGKKFLTTLYSNAATFQKVKAAEWTEVAPLHGLLGHQVNLLKLSFRQKKRFLEPVGM